MSRILLMFVTRVYMTVEPVLSTVGTVIMHSFARLPCCYYWFKKKIESLYSGLLGVHNVHL